MDSVLEEELLSDLDNGKLNKIFFLWKMNATLVQKEELLIEIPKAQASHKTCVVFEMQFKNLNTKQKSKFVPTEAIINCFVESGILIKSKCRCCPEHLIEN